MPASRARGRITARACAGAAAILSRFARSEQGNIGLIFGLAIIPFTLFVGAGVDIGRWLHARQETISAMDAAVLAGALALQSNKTDSKGAIAAAQAYYALNVKNRLTLADDSITFAPADNNTAFRSTGNAHIETPFLSLANVTTLPLLKADGSEYARAELDTNTSLEVSVMLDVTGSMKGQKFSDMKDAAKTLVDELMKNTANGATVKIGIVPFAEGVRLPASANAAARGNPAGSITVQYSTWDYWKQKYVTEDETYNRTDCVAERTGANKYTDAAPGPGNYVLTVYGDCGLKSDDEVLPLTSDTTVLQNKIKNLDIAGSTAGQIGTAWAWYLLSPNWKSLWPASAAQPYDTEKLKKIAVLMTDGEYNLEYDAKGIKTGEAGAGNAANGDSTTQARAVCAGMRTTGLSVYTIGFDLGGNKTAIDTLKGCASDASMFYNTITGDELKDAFADIARKINRLHLTH